MMQLRAGVILWIMVSASAHACDKAAFGIAIDPGHTPNNPGVLSARGTPEWRFNQNLASLLASELKATGFSSVFLTNEDDPELSLAERADRANQRHAKLFVSIHHDSVQKRYLSEWKHQGRSLSYSDVFNGYSLFISGRNGDPEGSFAFARQVGTEFLRSCLVPTLHHAEPIPGEGRDLVDKQRGIYRFDDLVVLRSTRMPAILIEAGLIVNRTEEVLLRNPAYQKLLAVSIARAIRRFCENTDGNMKGPEGQWLEGSGTGGSYSCP